MRQPYLLVKKSVGDKNKKYYYAKIWNPQVKKYSIWKSVKEIQKELGPSGYKYPYTSKAGATALVDLWLDSKELPTNSPELLSYLLNFWSEGSDYVKSKRMRKQSISASYIKNNYGGINIHFKAFLEAVKKKNILLDDVTPGLLESYLNYKTDKGDVSNRRINQILQAVKVALSEAYRLGKITSDPGKTVRLLPEDQSKRGIMTPGEVKKFFEAAKRDDYRFYAVNLLAATTGLRMGECRGLLIGDIKDGLINVSNNWQDGEGLKNPKWNSVRIVPLPDQTLTVLKKLISENPWKNEFVFYGQSRYKPFGSRFIKDRFKNTVSDIGITGDRNITFHSWRHYYNTMLRGNIPDYALRELTGHHSEKMTDRYSGITDEQRNAVAKLANDIV